MLARTDIAILLGTGCGKYTPHRSGEDAEVCGRAGRRTRGEGSPVLRRLGRSDSDRVEVKQAALRPGCGCAGEEEHGEQLAELLRTERAVGPVPEHRAVRQAEQQQTQVLGGNIGAQRTALLSAFEDAANERLVRVLEQADVALMLARERPRFEQRRGVLILVAQQARDVRDDEPPGPVERIGHALGGSLDVGADLLERRRAYLVEQVRLAPGVVVQRRL